MTAPAPHSNASTAAFYATATVPEAVYRHAMAKLAAAVNIVTTDGPGGRAGFTASAVCSICADPATLLICLNRSASAHAFFRANPSLCVNVLTPLHRDIAAAFAGKIPMAQRFDTGNWISAVTGAPVLADAAASFDCRIVERNPVGTHTLLLCEVIHARHREDSDALVYFSRGYHDLTYP